MTMKYKLGQKLYRVSLKNASLGRKKIKMVDEAGLEWYRYDRDVWAINVDKTIVIGLTETNVVGRVPDVDKLYDLQNRVYVSLGDYIFEDDILTSADSASLSSGYDFWFSDLEEAERMKLALQEKYNQKET